MAAWSASRVLSGSFAEIWVDGSRIAEASGIQMTIKMQRSDVQIGMDVDSKITGWRGEGQLRLRQVFSRFFDIVEGAAEGKDVALESLPLVNYAAGKVNEQTVPFRFLPGDLKQLSAIGVTEALA